MNETTTATETLNSGVFHSQREKNKGNRAVLQDLDRLEALEQSIPCATHAGETAILQVGKSLRFITEAVYECPTCSEQARLAELFKKMKRAGIPRDVWHATLDNFKTDRPGVNAEHYDPSGFEDAAIDFAEGDCRNLLLCGTPGIGKDHLAAALAKEALIEGRSVEWAECRSLFQGYRQACIEGDFARTNAIRRQIAHAYVLVLVDVAMCRIPDESSALLHEILTHRGQAGLQTVLTSGKPVAEVLEWLGSGTVSRLSSGKLYSLYGEWEDMRGTDNDGAHAKLIPVEPAEEGF